MLSELLCEVQHSGSLSVLSAGRQAAAVPAIANLSGMDKRVMLP